MPLFEIKKTAVAFAYEFPTNLIEDDPTLEQIWPAGAENNPGMLEELDKDETYLSTEWGQEEKYDGERLLLHFKDGFVRATTRRQAKKTGLMNEKTNNVPHIRSLYQEELEGTVLDGEVIYIGSANTLGLTQTMMNSLPEKSIELQRQRGWVTFKAFDCIRYKGRNVEDKPLRQRKELLDKVIALIYDNVPESKNFIQVSHLVSAVDYRENFVQITSDGGEGIILKKLGSAYRDKHCWLKVKNEEFFDAFVTGWEKGQGRNSEVCGFLKFSVWNENHDAMVEIARVGSLSDDLRKDIAENYAKYHLEVAELKAQEVTKFLRLRHPRIQRWRPDKGDAECGIDRIQTLQKDYE